MRHVIRHIAVAALLFAASGVLLRTTSESSDAYMVNAALKKHVTAGVTDAESVIQRFGDPLVRRERRGPGESEVLGYSHTSFAHHRFTLWPFMTSLLNRSSADTFFEVSDGVVTRYWTEL